MSLLFHPGAFHNPEFPRFTGIYRRILAAAREHACRSESTASLRESLLWRDCVRARAA